METVQTAGGEIPLVNPEAGGEWNPREKYTELVLRIQRILSDGEERTVRGVYYALEARGMPYEYRDVKTAVKRGRRAGFVDPRQIIDTSRRAETTVSTGYDSPEAFVEDMVDGIWNRYDENTWREQENHVEIWLEKAALSSVFAPICREWNVRLEAWRGDWSESKVYEATKRLNRILSRGQNVRILYFGDFNPSGYHSPVTVLERMAYYGLDVGRDEVKSEDPRYFDPETEAKWRIVDSDGDPVHDYPVEFSLERKAINLDHIEEFDLPENPNPSSTDKDEKLKRRFMRYVTEGRDTNVELNALKEWEREFLEDLIEDSIREYVDEEAKERVEERVRKARSRLNDVVEIHREEIPSYDYDPRIF